MHELLAWLCFSTLLGKAGKNIYTQLCIDTLTNTLNIYICVTFIYFYVYMLILMNIRT